MIRAAGDTARIMNSDTDQRTSNSTNTVIAVIRLAAASRTALVAESSLTR
jgi:hypothetical protein